MKKFCQSCFRYRLELAENFENSTPSSSSRSIFLPLADDAASLQEFSPYAKLFLHCLADIVCRVKRASARRDILPAYPSRIGIAKLPQTTSPDNYTDDVPVEGTIGFSYPKNVEIFPPPAHPTPGSGPPASTHLTPRWRVNMRAKRGIFASPRARTRSIPSGTNRPCMGTACCPVSHFDRYWRISNPSRRALADKLADVVDFPIPPLPYKGHLFH